MTKPRPGAPPRGHRRCSAVDRNGKSYTTAEMIEVFRKVYPISLKALMVMFPDISEHSMHARAQAYGVAKIAVPWSPSEDEACQSLHPDLEAIVRVTGRTLFAVDSHCRGMGLFKRQPLTPWRPEEDAILHRGACPPGRTEKAADSRRRKLGITLTAIRKARALDHGHLYALIEPLISRGYPHDKRQDMVQFVLIECLEGRCQTKPDTLKACAKRAVTAVYKLHPDRGAPVSLDAQIYDDGGTTVGDRISSDAFHF